MLLSVYHSKELLVTDFLSYNYIKCLHSIRNVAAKKNQPSTNVFMTNLECFVHLILRLLCTAAVLSMMKRRKCVPGEGA